MYVLCTWMLLIFFIQRWFIDGTVKCFEDGHLPLAIMAILILIFYVLVTIFVIAVVLKKIKVGHNPMFYILMYINTYVCS